MNNNMEQIDILKLWNTFSEEYDFELKEKIWQEKSKQFQKFWDERIMPENSKELTEEELGEIIRILDRNARGNTKEQEAVAKAMIAQGAWERMFKEIKENLQLKTIIYSLLREEDNNKIEDTIDELYLINEGRKNFLTGPNANAINDMMFAYNPKKYIAIVSLNHRMKVIDYFGFSNGPNFEEDSTGKKIVLSNESIIEGFKILGVEYRFPRAISDFLYGNIRDFWNKKVEADEVDTDDLSEETKCISEERIEKLKEQDYQKIIHQNFNSIFPNLKYHDESQEKKYGHYLTTEGKEMDFLCRDEKGDYVVIELKIKGSDQAVGQICRYMGWVKEYLCENNQKVKGIIVSQQKDMQLDYAIKVVPNIEIKRRIFDITLTDWEKDK